MIFFREKINIWRNNHKKWFFSQKQPFSRNNSLIQVERNAKFLKYYYLIFWRVCILVFLHFVLFAFCSICILLHLYFGKLYFVLVRFVFWQFVICRACVSYFFAFCHVIFCFVCILVLYFVLFVLWNTCILTDYHFEGGGTKRFSTQGFLDPPLKNVQNSYYGVV